MLTPEEIQSREFLVSLRGYDRDEVHAFLDEVAAEFGALLDRTDGSAAAPPGEPAAAAEVIAGPAPATPPAAGPEGLFAGIAAETQRILEAAHAAGEEIRRQAQAHADEERARARKETELVLVESTRRRDEITAAIATLEQRRSALLSDLRGLKDLIEDTLVEWTEPATAAPASEAEATASSGEDAGAASDGAAAQADESTSGANAADQLPLDTGDDGGGGGSGDDDAEPADADAGGATGARTDTGATDGTGGKGGRRS